MKVATKRKDGAPGIVSSSHLVSAKSVELSELEFGLIVAWNAFSRWAVRCMAAAGCPELTSGSTHTPAWRRSTRCWSARRPHAAA